jgi:Flp pilus assembly protein TadG
MKTSLLEFVRPKGYQSGVAALEFALVAIPFFVLLLGVIEFGRLMYLWNTVQEVTRSAARQAVVADFTDTGTAGAITQLKRLAVFRSTAGTLPAASEVSDVMVNIKYLQSDGATEVSPMPADPGDNISACLDVSRASSCIKYVEVKVCSGNPCVAVAFQPMFGMFPFLGDLTVPVSTVRMPAESLGFTP